MSVNIRDIQNFMYCPRRFALLSINRDWAENVFVVKADIMHENVHSGRHEVKNSKRIELSSVTVYVVTTDAEGRRRLRRVAKECVNYGQRVQNSVFEINIDYSSFLKLKNKLMQLIDEKEDSLRIYYLGNNWKKRVERPIIYYI